MRINLIVNTHRTDALEAARDTVAFLRAKGYQAGADRDAAPFLDVPAIAGEDLAEANLVVSFGGDGTLIRAAHVCSSLGTPILGVYYGRFGFVTQCHPGEIGAALSLFIDGEAQIEDRMMVQTELIRKERTVAALHSLNEAALQRSAVARMLHFRVVVDGRELTSYPADGVIVATPTGSTAYNLSAGGPIVDPRVRALILTALTPHTLSARPFVLRENSVVELSVESDGEAVLSCDGQSRLHLMGGDSIRVTRSPRVTRLVSLDPHDFLSKLSQRLLWSQYARPGD